MSDSVLVASQVATTEDHVTGIASRRIYLLALPGNKGMVADTSFCVRRQHRPRGVEEDVTWVTFLRS